jgi:hypothetical protein
MFVLSLCSDNVRISRQLAHCSPFLASQPRSPRPGFLVRRPPQKVGGFTFSAGTAAPPRRADASAAPSKAQAPASASASSSAPAEKRQRLEGWSSSSERSTNARTPFSPPRLPHRFPHRRGIHAGRGRRGMLGTRRGRGRPRAAAALPRGGCKGSHADDSRRLFRRSSDGRRLCPVSRGRRWVFYQLRERCGRMRMGGNVLVLSPGGARTLASS